MGREDCTNTFDTFECPVPEEYLDCGRIDIINKDESDCGTDECRVTYDTPCTIQTDMRVEYTSGNPSIKFKWEIENVYPDSETENVWINKNIYGQPIDSHQEVTVYSRSTESITYIMKVTIYGVYSKSICTIPVNDVRNIKIIDILGGELVGILDINRPTDVQNGRLVGILDINRPTDVQNGQIKGLMCSSSQECCPGEYACCDK